MATNKDRGIFRQFERKEELLEYLRQNVDYYTSEELLELLYMEFGFTWSDVTTMCLILAKYNIKRGKKPAMKTIHIESVYRFIPDIERMLNAKNIKKEKESKYDKKIQEKLDKLKQMDRTKEADDD